ncbi:enoyl-CoA hydratase-related protein [Kordiimonas gwangyangensis]|uniref:enoyl-CoA hydratase-related protein n=1 Tax=Kordiimonas gwangyangensis TaxID=288022 RepID=UPI000ACB7DE4|nr:enoyl-CoA hydratase-related protein [Kordiimonas gwangyangensis]
MEDILVEEVGALVTITLNRPERMNAFRQKTIQELNEVFASLSGRADIGVVILTGAGDRAFCTGGDVKDFTVGSGYEGASWTGIGLEVERLHSLMRSLPQPVIAAVNGYAIGGGNVLQVVCDMSIASDTAKFGQVGPKYGSFDAGFGTAYLARLVGERKAREIWMRCKTYSAHEALDMGLINAVVPADRLMEEAREWANDVLALSPTSLKMIKYSLNADSEHIAGITQLSFAGLKMYYQGGEAEEGHAAFREKRAPDYSRFRKYDK